MSTEETASEMNISYGNKRFSNGLNANWEAPTENIALTLRVKLPCRLVAVICFVLDN
jgi:hypothetical protein